MHISIYQTNHGPKWIQHNQLNDYKHVDPSEAIFFAQGNLERVS